MLDSAHDVRVDRSSRDYDLPFGDPRIDLAPLPRRPWADAAIPGIDAMAPGHLSAAFAAHVDRDELSGTDRVALLRAHQRLISHYQAELYRDMLAIRDVLCDQEGIEDEVASGLATEAEVRAALGWTRRRAEAELSVAIALDERIPETLDALGRGDIDMARARVIDRATLSLDSDDATVVAHKLLVEAPNLTTGELTVRARELAVEADATAMEKRASTAHENRRVVMQPTLDGTGSIHALDLAPHDATAITKHIDRLARSAKSATDQRTHDQVRADVFVDLVLSRTIDGRDATPPGDAEPRRIRGSRRADVEIRVDLTTLAGLDGRAADLRGFGPIVADIARDIAERSHGRWSYVGTDSDGKPAVTGPIRRRPTAQQARNVRAVQPTCGFPGCRIPASDCDLDHTRPWASGGPTSEDNLTPLCRHDHRLKSEAGWTYERQDDGRLVWTSPLGRTYRRGPPSG